MCPSFHALAIARIRRGARVLQIAIMQQPRKLLPSGVCTHVGATFNRALKSHHDHELVGGLVPTSERERAPAGAKQLQNQGFNEERTGRLGGAIANRSTTLRYYKKGENAAPIIFPSFIPNYLSLSLLPCPAKRPLASAH